MDHRATVFLLDRASRLAGTIDYGKAPQNALAKLTALAGPEHDARTTPMDGVGQVSIATMKQE